MEEQQLTWNTIHTDTRMIHNFGQGFQIIVDKQTEKAYKLELDVVKDSFSIKGLLLETYEMILLNFAKSINVVIEINNK